MLLTDKYADKIYGTITCYDRMIIQGYIPGWSHAEGMTGYLKANSIRIFDFSNFSQPLTEQIRQNAQRIADENGIEIEFIRKLRIPRQARRSCRSAVNRLRSSYCHLLHAHTDRNGGRGYGKAFRPAVLH